MVPGFLRAAARTKAAARLTASVAMPGQSADQRMCEYGTIDSADESAKEPGTICSSGPSDRVSKRGLQVPRMPSVSHFPFRVSL